MRGDPARSRDDEGEVAGQIIEYDLDTNDVVVRGEIEATFEIEVEGEDAVAPDFGSSDEASETGEPNPDGESDQEDETPDFED